MATIANRPNTALLVVDVQNGVVADTHERDAVVANIGSLVEKARAAAVPVVWVQQTDGNFARGARRSTARSSAATTRRSSATRTPPRTRRRGARRRPKR